MITDLDVIDVTPDGFLPREVTPAVTVNDLAAVTVTAGRRQRRDVHRSPQPTDATGDLRTRRRAQLVTTDWRSPGCTRRVGS
jgi:hypothetical protein